MGRLSCQVVVTIVAVLSLLLCATLCAAGVEVRYPIPVGGLMVLPIAWALHAYRQHLVLRHRITAGQCLSCGYDLRATPDRCPECGRLPGTVSN